MNKYDQTNLVTLSRRQLTIMHRKEMAKKGIKLGCHQVRSAKEKNREMYLPVGTCMSCHKLSKYCRCDNRTTWVKERVG